MEKQEIKMSDVVSIQKDVQYMRESMDRNFKDHEEIKAIIDKGLVGKVSSARFKPVEYIAYGLAGGVMFWVLNQLLGLIETVKAFI